jgi:aspartyl-tRNA(Asn)/glutamyl-tRNA(Gln) amidotransferase subunit C
MRQDVLLQAPPTGESVLSKDAVQHIAKLARLTLTEAETESFSHQLSAILESFNEIAKIDTKGVQPLVTPTEMTVALRVDAVEESKSTEPLLQNAPARAGNLFKVPPVV